MTTWGDWVLGAAVGASFLWGLVQIFMLIVETMPGPRR